MTVWIYVDTRKQVGALEPHLKVCQVWQTLQQRRWPFSLSNRH
jgi:hypothetical protein